MIPFDKFLEFSKIFYPFIFDILALDCYEFSKHFVSSLLNWFLMLINIALYSLLFELPLLSKFFIKSSDNSDFNSLSLSDISFLWSEVYINFKLCFLINFYTDVRFSFSNSLFYNSSCYISIF